MPGDASNQKAINDVLTLGTTALGLGAGVRSVMGLRDMLARSATKRRAMSAPAVVEVAVPAVQEEEEQRRALGPKLAQQTAPPAFTLPTGMGKPAPTWRDYWKGRMNVPEGSKPWYLPAMLGTAALSLYGGYKGIDALTGHWQKKEKEEDLESAKDDYRRALVEQYSPDSPNIKKSAADELGRDLSELYHLYKQAEPESTASDWGGAALSGYGALAALLAGTSGLATYNWTKSRSPDARLAKAIQQRERLRWATRPPEIYAVAKPQPVKLQSPRDMYSPGTEEDEELVKKYAANLAALYKP